MRKFFLTAVILSLLLSCSQMITSGVTYSGQITFGDKDNTTYTTGNTFIYDSYFITGTAGTEFYVEFWGDAGVPMNLEWTADGYQRDICSLDGNSYDDGYFTLREGRNSISVYCINTALPRDGAAYSFTFIKQ